MSEALRAMSKAREGLNSKSKPGSFEGGAVGGVHALEEIASLVEKAAGLAFGPELGDALEVVHHVGREDAVVLLRVNAPAHAKRGIRLWLRQIVIF